MIFKEKYMDHWLLDKTMINVFHNDFKCQIDSANAKHYQKAESHYYLNKIRDNFLGQYIVCGEDGITISQYIGKPNSQIKKGSYSRMININPTKLIKTSLENEGKYKSNCCSLDGNNNFIDRNGLVGIKMEQVQREMIRIFLDQIIENRVKYFYEFMGDVMGISWINKSSCRQLIAKISYMEIYWDIPLGDNGLFIEHIKQYVFSHFNSTAKCINNAPIVSFEYQKNIEIVFYYKTVNTLRAEIRIRSGAVKPLFGSNVLPQYYSNCLAFTKAIAEKFYKILQKLECRCLNIPIVSQKEVLLFISQISRLSGNEPDKFYNFLKMLAINGKVKNDNYFKNIIRQNKRINILEVKRAKGYWGLNEANQKILNMILKSCSIKK